MLVFRFIGIVTSYIICTQLNYHMSEFTEDNDKHPPTIYPHNLSI